MGRSGMRGMEPHEEERRLQPKEFRATARTALQVVAFLNLNPPINPSYFFVREFNAGIRKGPHLACRRLLPPGMLAVNFQEILSKI